MEPPEKRPKTMNGAEGKESSLDFSHLGRFQMTRVLNEDSESKSVCLEGLVDGKKAVLILNKLPFSAETLDRLVSKSAECREEMRNDIYGKYACLLDPELNHVKANLICPATEKHIKKYESSPRHIIYETPAMYKALTSPFLETEKFSIEWVYNFLSKKAEADTIVYEDPDPETGFIMGPDYKWNGKQMEDLYVLGIVHSRKLKSLRTLNQSHLPLLKKLWLDGTKAIHDKYKVEPSQIRAYLHYQPSYYHLHVHFTHVQYHAPGINAEKSHLLPTVIYNIERQADFYQRAILPFVVKESENIFQYYRKAGYNFKSPQMNPISIGTRVEDPLKAASSPQGVTGLFQFFKALGKAKHEPCGEHWNVTFGESAWRLAIMAMCVSPKLDRKRLIQCALTSAFTSLGSHTDDGSVWATKLREVRGILFESMSLSKACELFDHYETHVSARRGLPPNSDEERIYRNLLEFEEALLLWEELKKEGENPPIQDLLKRMCHAKFPGHEKYEMFKDGTELQNLLYFFLQISCLSSLKRTGWVNMKVRDPERVAGHMFRMGMMAMILEDQKSEAILGGSAIILSIVHDIAECIVGDITPHDPVTPEEKHDKEMAAMKTLVEKLPGPLAKDLYDAFSRYEFQPENDRSAIMTKDLDKFDMILQAMEYEEQAPSRGAFLEDFFNSTKGVFQTERIKTLDKELRDYRAKFHEAK
ncbi:hypothetical protein TCAL_15740 [Tigriopus californicus]|uniref:m7GpppX diphosphatase n=1 Tax=Tigriopus californicus TaxID=6832 RepID=A0A553P882_TIGCA|nr:uncharacterized protein LOC131877521 [Tigriopus californicus]TRY73879.1 hypothetical protein TCAL_15740 [Tigriopus californicus]|eukprot:TCALIF_09128-PB protein Name:"Similar to DCPS m7GpppX diphosphatase (Sus scrofa)" AED:0.17 eAED:0.17 QI:15/1/1/1/1/1/8/34/700